MSAEKIITRYAEAVRLLADPRYDVVPAATEGAESGVAWLRATVSRFAAGAVHARRRVLVERILATVDPDTLRLRAYGLATMNADLRPGALTVTVLAEALGVTAGVAPLVAAVAPSYVPTSAVTVAADDAVNALVGILGGGYDETTAATIAVLVQACDATDGLVTTALATPDIGATPTGALLVTTLRHDPPVPYLWRTTPGHNTAGAWPRPASERVGIDVKAANRDPAAQQYLTFGAGPRPGNLADADRRHRRHGSVRAMGPVPERVRPTPGIV